MVLPLLLGVAMTAAGGSLCTWYATLSSEDRRRWDHDFRQFIRKQMGLSEEEFMCQSEYDKSNAAVDFARKKNIE